MASASALWTSSGSGISGARPYDGMRTISTVQNSLIPRREEPVTTEAQVREALRSVMDPEIGRPIEEIGMLQASRSTAAPSRSTS